jgi:hypothetical protein
MTNILKDVARSDKARIIGKMFRNDDGYLQGTAIVARSGILEYFEGGRMVKEYVPPEELARADSLATLRLKPVTNGHPSARLVTPSNVKQFQVGMTGENVHSDGDVLSSTITINDNVAISEVNAGKRELSCGYRCDIVNEPGTTTSGERYDRMQTNRRYNHVAICDLGRAGPVAALNMDEAQRNALLGNIHLDAADVFEVGKPDYRNEVAEVANINPENVKFDDFSVPQKRSRPMPVTIKIDGIDYPEQAPEVSKHIEKLDAAVVAAKAATATVQTKLDAETAAHVATKTKLDAANAEIAGLPAKIAAAAKARAELVAQAKPHMDKAEVDKIDTLTDAQIRLAVAAKAFPAAKDKIAAVKTDNADAVQVWYDAALTTLKNDKTDTAAAANRVAANGVAHNDGADKGADSKNQPKTKEDAESEVCNRHKKTSNRDALLK